MNPSKLQSYGSLCKLRVSLYAALSAATGYILAAPRLSAAIMVPTLGVLFLSCGASALNQFQERHIDARMRRTEKRPIPAGQIRPGHALLLSLLLCIQGLLILSLPKSFIAPGIGFSAVVLYNGMYTYLKRISAFAAVPGALVGALPPFIGWVAGGGELLDYRIFGLCFFFFMWQVPHFWLFLLAHAGDYEQARLPSLTRIFSQEQLSRIVFMWILAAVASCFIIPLWTTTLSRGMSIFSAGAALWLLWEGSGLIRFRGVIPRYRLTFRKMNYYMLLNLLILHCNSLFF